MFIGSVAVYISYILSKPTLIAQPEEWFEFTGIPELERKMANFGVVIDAEVV